MLKWLKHLALLVLYLVAYQLAMGFLILPGIDGLASAIPPHQLEGLAWFGGILGFTLLAGLTLVLWKVVFPKKKVEIALDGAWATSALYPLLVYVAYFIFQLLIPLPESTNQEAVRNIVLNYPLHAFLAVVLFAGPLEELIFRGFLATYFFPEIQTNKTALLYILVSASLFSLVHSPTTVLHFLLYAVMGANLAWLYLTKKNLAYPVALHMVNNALAYGMILLLS